jgi:DNA modification methylase
VVSIELIDIKKLTLLKNNPRKITKDEMDKLCESLKNDPNFFHNRPVLVNQDKIDAPLIVYAGNQRVLAAKKLKWKQVPCIIEKGLSEDLIKERIIKDNKHAGTWDYDILANEWELETLIDCGFTPEELELDIAEQIESDEEDDGLLEPGKDEEAITKLGDVYELNGHRLVCGDSTHPDVVASCLDGQTPILMVTDPPYGVNYDPSWRKAAGKGQRASGKVQNDDQVNWALAWHLFPGSAAYIWHAGKYCGEVQKSLEDAEFEMISQIIWAKQHFALSRGDYHWQHEPCWYAIRKGHQHNWQGSRKESTLWEIANLNCFGKSKDESEERTAHSTQKPIECMSRPIKNNSAEGEGVYDPFLVSGTTLIASEMLNRKCYGIELSPAYCDIIVNRWKNFMIKNNKTYQIKRNGELIV